MFAKQDLKWTRYNTRYYAGVGTSSKHGRVKTEIEEITSDSREYQTVSPYYSTILLFRGHPVHACINAAAKL